MPRLTVQGTLTDRGSATPFPVPLAVTLTLSRDDTHDSYTDALDIVCPTGGAFAVDFTVSRDVTATFTTSGAPGSGTRAAGGHIAVTIAPNGPGLAPFAYTSPVVAFFSRNQTFLGVAESLVDTLAVDVNLSGVAHHAFSAIIRSDDNATLDAFADVDRLTCEVLRDRVTNPAARVVAAPGKDGAPQRSRRRGGGGRRQGRGASDAGARHRRVLRPDHGPRSAGRRSVHRARPGATAGPGRPHVLRPIPQPGPRLRRKARASQPAPAGLLARSQRRAADAGGAADRRRHHLHPAARPYLPGAVHPDGSRSRLRRRRTPGTRANRLRHRCESGCRTGRLDRRDAQPEAGGVQRSTVLDDRDIDELPAWLWVAIGVVGFPLGLSGAALSVALIAAIELALKPVVGTLVRARVLGQLSAPLKQDVNAEIDNQLASAADDFGVAMTDDVADQLRSNAWIETEELSLDADAVAGFGGVWHQLVGQVNWPRCSERSTR